MPHSVQSRWQLGCLDGAEPGTVCAKGGLGTADSLGSRALGFSQELFDPGAGASAGPLPAELAAAVPSLVAMLSEVAHDDPGSTLGWCDDQTEFEFGLDLLLDGLERRRTAS